METVYIAGGCLWGVQHFFDILPGVLTTEAGRANGKTNSLDGEYDGYAECVKVSFDENVTTITRLMEYLFEIIDPYSLNKQGIDVKSGGFSKVNKIGTRNIDTMRCRLRRHCSGMS